MPQVEKGSPAGLSALQLSTMDSTGFWTGQAGTAPANATVSSAYYTRLISGGTPQPRDQNIVEFEGGNGIVGQLAFGTRTLTSFDVTTDHIEPDMIALAVGGLVDQSSNDRWTIFSNNPTKVRLGNIGIMITQEYQSQDDATQGNTRYLTCVIPIATVTFQWGGAAYQAKSPSTLTITPTTAGKFPNGVAFGANQTWEGNETDHFFIITDNPVAYTMFIADGADDTYVTGYRPSSSIVTDANTTANWQAVNGTATAPSSVNTSTGVVTLAAAGSAADKVGVIYETGFIAI